MAPEMELIAFGSQLAYRAPGYPDIISNAFSAVTGISNIVSSCYCVKNKCD